MQQSADTVTIVFDMDSTLLSIETLDRIIETALRRSSGEKGAEAAMAAVEEQMAKGMSGTATLSETIPARITIAKEHGAIVTSADFQHVIGHINDHITPAIRDALAALCSATTNENTRIVVVSGGPQECVDEAVKRLQQHITAQMGISVPTFLGIGNKIVITEEGEFDTEMSVIKDGKVETIGTIVNNPTKTIMIGDGATDVAVYDEGAADYFIAYGAWVKRPVLFDREEDAPRYQKVTQHKQFAEALTKALGDIQNRD